jgi:hypothetical protein
MDDAYARLRAYADDLNARVVAQEAWKRRHPKWETFDDFTWEQVTDVDPYPQTNDLVTARRLLDVMLVALAAYEDGGHG